MVEFLQNFEQAATNFSPTILVGPGVAFVLIGLFVWLGGLRLKRALAAVMGAIAGGICGYFFAGQNIILAIVIAGLAAVIAALLQRVFIIILMGLLVAVLGFMVLGQPYLADFDMTTAANLQPTPEQAGPLKAAQSLEVGKSYVVAFTDRIWEIFSQMPIYNWVIIGVSALVIIVIGFFLWRLVSAVCCASFGTILIFAGMILLLLYKGAMPITNIIDKQVFYLAVLAAMTAFGVVIQMLFCRPAAKSAASKKQKSKNTNGSEKQTSDWRTT